MRVKGLLHKILKTAIHSARLSALIDVVETSVVAKSLSVTSIGRRMLNGAQTRSNIRKTDRIYSNSHLDMERIEIYKKITSFLTTNKKPIIVIDGTKILNTEFYALRASFAASGRAITIYDEVFKRSEYGNIELYKRFLKGLSEVLPKSCKPILVTDAEFRGPWFQLVLDQNWDVVGRLRSKRKCALRGDSEFYEVDSAKVLATAEPKYIGPGVLNIQNSVAGNFYSYKKPAKGRHAYTRSGKHSDTEKSLKQSRSAAEPWFIFSSLKIDAKKIIGIYKTRMSIEENIRDTKSERYGLSMNLTRTKKINRCRVMLLVAALAGLIAYMLGCAAELKGLEKTFQVNSKKNNRVISRFFLGCQIIHRGVVIVWQEIRAAIIQVNIENDVYA